MKIVPVEALSSDCCCSTIEGQNPSVNCLSTGSGAQLDAAMLTRDKSSIASSSSASDTELR